MKTAQLPPVRVTPDVRHQIESVLHDGETLSQFVEQAAVEAAQRRKAQMEFVARGRASLARARQTGQYHAAAEVFEAMQGRLEARLAAHRPRELPAKRGS
ncbi:YlcI/YnfO family protein [Ottowia sp.]|uniref:YlcI/YnfO family protein n=1 Tax=Ottowia sp. TaxID=1898956 RepID=UPI0039E2D977